MKNDTLKLRKLLNNQFYFRNTRRIYIFELIYKNTKNQGHWQR